MNQQTKIAFLLAGIGIELSSFQTNTSQGWLPLLTGAVLVAYVLFVKETKS